MTYWIVAITLTAILVAWYMWSGKSSKAVDAMDAAICAGDEEALSRLLKEHPEVVAELNDVTFLLMKSVLLNRPGMVQEVLDMGHRGRDLQQCALLHDVNLLNLAIEKADADVLRMLLVAGMDVGAETVAPVLVCYSEGKPEHLRVLEMFEATTIGAEQNETCLTPLHVASVAFSENAEAILQMVGRLLESGADVNAMTTGGNTPLDAALDETHDGAGDSAALVELLRQHGGVTGRSLRVPNAAYTGCVYLASALENLPAVELPDGVRMQLINAPVGKELPLEGMEFFGVTDAELGKIKAHKAHVQVSVSGAHGEDPLAVAKRCVVALYRIAEQTDCVAVQLGDSIVVEDDYHLEDDAPCNPMLYAPVKLGRVENKYIVMDTDGLAVFGLSEVELVMEQKLLKKNKKLNLMELIWNLRGVASAGVSAWENGHTASVNGVFCRIFQGKHALTEKEGIIFYADDYER